jgi:DAACS family dicarboxylate/amino acid:cation (Na+ or H+) symporter
MSEAANGGSGQVGSGRGLALHHWILIGLVIGAVAGLAAHAWGSSSEEAKGIVATAVAVAEPIGKVFLRLMFMVVVPLVIAALALAVVGLGDLRRLGWIGLKTIGFTIVLSGIAVGLGLVLVNVIGPGRALSAERRAELLERSKAKADEKIQQAKAAKSLSQTLLDMIPENPLQEAVGAVDGSSKGNGMLAVMCFALVLGVAITVKPDECKVLVGFLEGVFAAAMVVIDFAMRLAPVCAGLLVFALCATLGFEVLTVLFWFVLTVLLGLGLHLVVSYSACVALFGGMSPIAFFSKVSEAMLTAFGTSSSSATLPTAIRVAETQLKLPRDVSNFVLTVGATGNQNGTALYEGVVVLFLAQVYGVELSIAQQLTVVLMAILAGVGTAGVPGGSLPLIVVLMQQVGVPAEGIGIILGIDRVLDMCRTVLNVTGDLCIATCVARTEKSAPGV